VLVTNFQGWLRKDLTVIEAKSGEGSLPNAAGVEAKVARTEIETEGRPVAKDDGLGGFGEGEPGLTTRGPLGGWPGKVGVEAQGRVEGPHAHENAQHGGEPCIAYEIFGPGWRLPTA